jgi:UDP-N-acetylglucosamine acyltransferase
MGARNKVGYGAIIGAEPQDLAFKGVASFVEIGNDNVIREYVTIHRGTKEGTSTTLGNNCFLMAGSHLGHNCQLRDGVILVNNTLLAGYVTIDDKAFLGGATLVHQFTRIGRLAITRGGTRIGKDIPPFCMAVATNTVTGLNRIGLRRSGMSPQVRKEIQHAYTILYRSGLNVTQALDRLKETAAQGNMAAGEIEEMIRFIAGSKRGICRHRDAREAEQSNDED